MTENCQMTLKHYQKRVRIKWENTTNYTQLCLFKATRDYINTMSVVLPKVLLHLFIPDLQDKLITCPDFSRVSLTAEIIP